MQGTTLTVYLVHGYTHQGLQRTPILVRDIQPIVIYYTFIF